MEPMWGGSSTYRVKPAPPKPREFWITGEFHHETEQSAVKWVQKYPEDGPFIHVREVLP
jgi:hypothetical protein